MPGMKKNSSIWVLGLIACASLSTPALSETIVTPGRAGAAAAPGELPPYLECVPYARHVSGIDIYGDAFTWWDQAQGRYARGHVPKKGAVMAIRPHSNMRLGHVATVSRVVDSRTVLLNHANWSPVNGRRGQVEDGVRAVDVSARNDWSEVRIWYGPVGDLGTTRWPVSGFIYPTAAPSSQATTQLARTNSGRSAADTPVADKASSRGRKATPSASNTASSTPATKAGQQDPIGAIIAKG